jgi:hypothetical protein
VGTATRRSPQPANGGSWQTGLPEEINHPTIGVSGSRAKSRRTFKMGGNAVNRPRAADDFPTIRARLEELRRERKGAQTAESELQGDPARRGRSVRWPPSEMSAGSGRVRQSGPIRG